MKYQTKFLPIASSKGVTIFTPTISFISFTNSPYYSHKHGLAVDIYPLSSKATGFSPVQGDILEVFKVKSPQPKYFQAADDERLLIIQPIENPSLVVRILHTDYDSSSKAKLPLGSPIGNMVRSGFFDFWTECHIHVEVRNAKHLLRAKGSLPMLPLTKGSRLLGIFSEKTPRLRVVCANQNYILVGCVDSLREGIMTLGPMNGFSCKVGKTIGILDAGIPYYQVGSVHFEEGVTVFPGDKVKLWGTIIGEVVESRNGMAIFKSIPIETRLNEYIIRGLAFYLWVGKSPIIKLIRPRPTHPKWHEGEEVKVHICKTGSS